MNRVKKEAAQPKPVVAGDDVAMIIYTSGTTGNPKVCDGTM
jgi:long-subunit acyl-CoA synthetase (AMP-forming)